MTIRVGESGAGQRLVDFAAEWLSRAQDLPLTRSDVRRLAVGGALRVDGQRVPPGRPLRRGQVVEARVDPRRLVAREGAFVMSAARVLLDDGHVLAVDKPPGLPMHPTADRARPSLTTAVESWLAAGGRVVRLGVHQRLDRDTSGVVVFALSLAANRGLAAAFATHAVEKTYHALTVRPGGRVPAAWEDATPVEGRSAHTAFRVERALSRALLVEARPRTGRRHQVRVHLAGAGLPLLGDVAHGGPPASRVFLHARGLVLPHPVTGVPLRLESSWPADFQAAVEAGGAVGPPVPAR